MFWYQRLAFKISAAVGLAVAVPLLAFILFAANSGLSREMLAGSALLLTALTAAVVFVLTRRLTVSLEDAIRAAEDIAHGKLNQPLAVRGSNEAVRLASAMNGVSEYLSQMSDYADKIANGNLNLEVRPRSAEDHFGLAFKNMTERALKLVQTADERDRLQNSIMRLLEEVADVASGDLTAQAAVASDATGAIADAFNFMIVELRGIIGQVKQTSLRVDASASEIKATSENIRQRTENQSNELIGLSAALEKMASNLQSVAAAVDSSAQTSGGALANVRQGAVIVQNNLEATSRLRVRVQETTERIKRLDERSGEINSIVKIVGDLAQRTGVLALNASIQATAHGSAGRGFVQVAEEVERLAERSAGAAKQIDVLTKAIQGETSEAVTAMETAVKEAAANARLSREAGDSLSEIEAVAVRLYEISQTAARAAQVEATDSAQISMQMRRVASASADDAANIKESAENTAQLLAWAQELRHSVASFRLPELNAAAVDQPLSALAVRRADAVVQLSFAH